MVLTDKQSKGLDVALERYQMGYKFITISGYAGTGKTTLVRFIIDALMCEGIEEDDVCYCAYTGKACQVLSRKGNKNVSTLHRLLYKSVPLPNGGFRRMPKGSLEYKILVVDEVSMVPQNMIESILHYPVFVIFLGDPFQLPPVKEDEANHLLDEPHVFLDEIMRQAAESEIIRYTLDLRNGIELPLEYDGNEIRIFRKDDLCDGMLTWADQILVATNKTRVSINNTCRELYGFEGDIQDGDKVVCVENDWERISPNGEFLVNGSVGHIESSFPSFFQIPNSLPPKAKMRGKKLELFRGNFITEIEEEFKNVAFDKEMLLNSKKGLDWQTEFALKKSKFYSKCLPDYFEFGYALTYWKAQGSEWDKVLVIEEGFPFDKQTHLRAMYTALTRASSKVTLIRNK